MSLQLLTIELHFVRKGCAGQVETWGTHRSHKLGSIASQSLSAMFRSHTQFSRPCPAPSAISRFSRFFTAIQRFFTANSIHFHGQILFSQLYLYHFFTAIPGFHGQWAERSLITIWVINGPLRNRNFPQFLTIEPRFVRKGCAQQIEIPIFYHRF